MTSYQNSIDKNNFFWNHPKTIVKNKNGTFHTLGMHFKYISTHSTHK